MKAQIKLINPNACGANSVETFESIADLKKHLNESLYYGGEVYLWVECFYDYQHKYSETDDLRSLLSEAKHYDSILCVAPTFEEVE